MMEPASECTRRDLTAFAVCCAFACVVAVIFALGLRAKDGNDVTLTNCRPTIVRPDHVVHECDGGLQFKQPTPTKP